MSIPDFPPAYAKRLLSLDVFRGLTLAVMILVNNLDSEVAWDFTQHADWNGLTIADLVFPAFLFAAGASIVFAIESRLLKGITRAQLGWHLLRRSAVLFALGLVVNIYPYFQWAHFRFYGVLQRVALCYLAAGVLYLLNRRIRGLLLICVLLLGGYWVLLSLVPVPGAGMPGKDMPLLDSHKNLASWLDRQLLAGHLYTPAEPPTYDQHDPEGLLSTLPAIATTLLGVIAAIGLRNRRSEARAKTLRLAVFALVCLALGYAWSLLLPLNKNLWTSSYVLVAAGWSMAALALLHWLIEERGWSRGWSWPWLVFGSNSIVCYLFSEILVRTLLIIPATFQGTPTNAEDALYEYILLGIPSTGWATFLYAVLYVLVSFVPVWLLWRRRIFIKI